MKLNTGFFAQDDVLHPHLTVRETWSSPTTSRSPPVDGRGEAEKLEPAVAVDSSIRTRLEFYSMYAIN
jgi:hypothetical protein